MNYYNFIEIEKEKKHESLPKQSQKPTMDIIIRKSSIAQKDINNLAIQTRYGSLREQKINTKFNFRQTNFKYESQMKQFHNIEQNIQKLQQSQVKFFNLNGKYEHQKSLNQMKTKDVAAIKATIKIKNVPTQVLHKNQKNDLHSQLKTVSTANTTNTARYKLQNSNEISMTIDENLLQKEFQSMEIRSSSNIFNIPLSNKQNNKKPIEKSFYLDQNLVIKQQNFQQQNDDEENDFNQLLNFLDKK